MIVIGTNCGNCLYFRGRRVKVRTNYQGGAIIRSRESLSLARMADLITLPGKISPRGARMCVNPRIDQPVNDRMCCDYWDNSEALREWER